MAFKVALILILGMSSVYAATSTSDFSEYRNVCYMAATDESAFSLFKKNPTYNRILEHVSVLEGQQYLDIINTTYSHLIPLFKEFRKNDLLGNPVVFEYPEIGKISPTTLRYAKVAGDIEFLFGNLDDKNIIEIGAGYGGQCLLISKLYQFKKYDLVDIDEPLLLINKYLTRNKVSNFRCINPKELRSGEEYDLVISNYAFSECIRSVQQFYLDRVIKNCKHGYLTINSMDTAGSGGRYTFYDLVRILRSYRFDLRVLPEEPCTGVDNLILIW